MGIFAQLYEEFYWQIFYRSSHRLRMTPPTPW